MRRRMALIICLICSVISMGIDIAAGVPAFWIMVRGGVELFWTLASVSILYTLVVRAARSDALTAVENRSRARANLEAPRAKE
jgi:hypothetical protein